VGVRAAAVDPRRDLRVQQRPGRGHDYPQRNGDAAGSHRNRASSKEVSGVSHGRRICVVAAVAVAGVMLFPAVALAAGSNVGENVANLLKGYASELYGGIVAVVSLMFLVNRRYTELAVFLFAAVVVAWMVFASSDIAGAAEAIGKQIFG
jgi:hypothetical protein